MLILRHCAAEQTYQRFFFIATVSPSAGAAPPSPAPTGGARSSGASAPGLSSVLLVALSHLFDNICFHPPSRRGR